MVDRWIAGQTARRVTFTAGIPSAVPFSPIHSVDDLPPLFVPYSSLGGPVMMEEFRHGGWTVTSCLTARTRTPTHAHTVTRTTAQRA